MAKTSPMHSTNDDYYSHSPQADMDLTGFLKKMKEKNKLEPNDKKNIYNLGLMILGLNLAAHGNRDIKPDNIFVYMDNDGTASFKLSDFGLSIGYDKMDPSNDANRTGGLGTPLYMPPEVIESKGYSSQADTYSMGCILALVYGRKGCNRNNYKTLPHDLEDDETEGGKRFCIFLRTLSGENSNRRKKYGLIGSYDPSPSLRTLRIYEPVMSSIINKMLKVDPNKRGKPTEHLKKFIPTWLDEVIPDTGDETVKNNIMKLKNFICPKTEHTLDKDIQAVKLLVTAIAINFQSPYFMEKLNKILKKENGAKELFKNIKLLDAENDPEAHKYARACVTHHENLDLKSKLKVRYNVIKMISESEFNNIKSLDDLNNFIIELKNNDEFEAFIKEMKDKIPEIIKTSNDLNSFLKELKNKEFKASLIPDFKFKHRHIKRRVLADLVVFALFFPIIIPIIISMILFPFAKTKKTLMGCSFTFAKTNRTKLLDDHILDADKKEQPKDPELITGRVPES